MNGVVVGAERRAGKGPLLPKEHHLLSAVVSHACELTHAGNASQGRYSSRGGKEGGTESVLG